MTAKRTEASGVAVKAGVAVKVVVESGGGGSSADIVVAG
jgi:hypothetical protein